MKQNNSKTQINCGCIGCLIEFITFIIFCMIFSLFLGNGKFYNKCIKKINVAINCDTIQTNK